MAKGKNKKLSKKGKNVKRGDKHPFTKKEWFSVIAPASLQDSKSVGWTCCKKPTGTQIVADFLKNRVAEMSLGDLTNKATDCTKRIKVTIDEIQGSSCFTSFHSYERAREATSALLRKRQTLIEINADVKSQDGTVFRLFLVVVTTRRQNQVKLNSYATHSKVCVLRKKIVALMTEYAANTTSAKIVHEIIHDALAKDWQHQANKIIPGCNLLITKMKIAKKGIAEVRVNEVVAAQVSETKHKESPDAVNVLSK